METLDPFTVLGCQVTGFTHNSTAYLKFNCRLEDADSAEVPGNWFSKADLGALVDHLAEVWQSL